MYIIIQEMITLYLRLAKKLLCGKRRVAVDSWLKMLVNGSVWVVSGSLDAVMSCRLSCRTAKYFTIPFPKVEGAVWWILVCVILVNAILLRCVCDYRLPTVVKGHHFAYHSQCGQVGLSSSEASSIVGCSAKNIFVIVAGGGCPSCLWPIYHCLFIWLGELPN